MNKIRQYGLTILFVVFCLVFMGNPVSADDTCVFSVTADDLPPNIVLLLDSGAEMEQIVWHAGFNNSIDYTPIVPPGLDQDVVEVPGGNGFFNDLGYGIIITGGQYYLVDIPADLDISDYNDRLQADVTDAAGKKGTWIINGRTITLPAEPSTVAVDGVIDNANYFRYSKNYLNWLFFNGSYAGDGTDLSNMSRFYYAKKSIMTVAKGTGYKAKFGLYYFTNLKGGSQAQPLEFVVNAEEDGVDNDGDGDIDEFDEILTSAFINNINNMHTVLYSPLAEGLSTVGYYYSSPSSGASGGYCQSNFTIVISPGVSSEDQGTTSSNVPAGLSDYDGDNGGIGEGNIKEDNTNDGIDNDGDTSIDEADEAVIYAIPLNQNGSTYLDDVAYYLYSNDIVGDAPSTGSLCYDALTSPFSVGETITGGTSGATGSITAVNVDVGATSGCLEIETVTGTFQDNENLTGAGGGSAAVNGFLFDSGEGYQNVITYTVGFMGDKEGDLFLINTSNNGNGNKDLYDTSDEDYGKYHYTADSPEALSTQLLAAVTGILSRTSTFMAPVVPVTRTTSGDKIYMAFFKPGEGNFWEGNVTKFGISSDNQIIDATGALATWPNGAMRVDAVPYWATIDWADVTKSNYIHNSNRNIYTYRNNLTPFESTNAALTAAILGNPTRSTADIINYVRGADVLDEDGDTFVDENRSIITGDVLHSEPVIFQYNYTDGSSKTMVYFGANDGMLHAVLDATQSSGADPINYGTEEWAFIPPDQLPRLKEMIEGFSHQSYVDSTPKIYFKDVDKDGFVDTADGDRVIIVCGERKGGFGYFALDVTDPSTPQYLWRINQYDDSALGWAAPTTVVAELGQTWSEPQFGVVKTSDGDMTGTPVLFIGGGYSSNNFSGKAVIAVNVLTGAVVKKFTTGMNYSFPSTVLVVDENDNGFVDKVYVGDLGGQLWRFASFTDSGGNALGFPNCNENIDSWTEQIFFKTDDNNSRKIFYPPSLTLEKGYDMVFVGTGDRENACCNNDTLVCSFSEPDIIAAVKETHSSTPIVGEEDSGGLMAKDLVDVTDPAVTPPDLSTSGNVDSNLYTDQGWYVRLVDDIGNAVGEKVLAEGVIFYKTLYITTFTPNEDPCAPGGDGKLYALSHLTGSAVLDFDNDSVADRISTVGGGIPSKPVMLITQTGTKLLISVGSANPEAASPTTGAGVRNVNPLLPPINFFYKFWKEVF
ncbi:MAG: hypothetical protein JRE28_12935 [Deltaproteobacteria bacterium]|nr:hypothetical protein [Deltaproteobacteria bacterium]